MRHFDKDQFRCIQLAAGDSLSPEQRSDVAKLIYDTDSYIYPTLFGEGPEGRMRAVRILSELLASGADVMFAKKNLFVLGIGDEIAGIILWYKGSMQWDPAPLLDAAAGVGIALKEENVMKVSREYVADRYTSGDSSEDQGLELINVCVKSSLRGRGAGDYMLERFVEAHPRENMKLVVLADNIPAVNLYQKFGFSVTKETDGFSLSHPKPRCFTMERHC